MSKQLDEALCVPLDLVKKLPHLFVKRVSRYQNKYFEIPITAKIIGFCGCFYPAIEIDGHTYYSTDQLGASLSKSFLRKYEADPRVLEELLEEKDSSRFYWHCERQNPLTHHTWTEKLTEIAGKTFDDVFIQLNVPAFKVEYVAMNNDKIKNKFRCTLNPFLKADSFQKVKGPAEAFQEISMCLGNQLARQPDPVSKISDEIMRDEKGFDEWSFRRHKEDDKKYKKNQRNPTET